MNETLLTMHQVMVGDRRRLAAYDRALARAVRPGNVVLDVGAGTLVLSALALRHGARHVYAVEADPETAALAARIATESDLLGRLTLIQGDARTVQLPEPADVIVAEMMGNLGPEEEMCEILHVVAGNNLAPGGRLVPERLVTHLQAIEFDDEGWGVWNDDDLGLSLSAVQEYAGDGAQLHFFARPPRLLSEPQAIGDDVLGCEPSGIAEVVNLEVVRPGTLHAVIGYFTATLGPETALSNFPSYPGCNWAVWVWPVRHTEVGVGDRVRAAIQRPTDDVRSALQWRLDCAVGRFASSNRR